MEPTEREDVTMLLSRMRDGDNEARARLIALVYPRLKQMAAQRMKNERPDHTLQPTALVHEVFLRLSDEPNRSWHNRVHFFAFAAELMRHVLVDAARRKRAVKRGGPSLPIELDDSLVAIQERPDVVLEVDRLLSRLEALDVSERTVKREWQMARAWILKELGSR